jgi:hypothetical protein
MRTRLVMNVSLLISLLPSLAAAQKTVPAGQVAIGSIAGVAAEAVSVNATAINIPRYKPKLLSGYTEYNTGTCMEISPGSWSLQAPLPAYGKTSYGTLTGTLSNGDCPGHTFTFAVIYYTWTKHNNEADQDKINAIWKTPDGAFNSLFNFVVQVPIVHPASETTVFAGWDAKGLGLWQQTLHPPASDPSFDFSYDTVRESNPGGGGPDTCWFKGSAISPFTAITGGTWYPEKGVWGFDHVGWFTTSVTYYRKHHRTPCGTKFPQQMQHKAQVEPGFVNYGNVNTLGGSFTGTTVTSIRAGKTATVKR